jgi:hypothetical protein
LLTVDDWKHSSAVIRQFMNFVNPFFLIGALAAAVPILLHLIKREHARKIEFPTLMFLRRVSRRTIRYQKLRHLLLLLLRILAFLLIVLAFMRPYREKAQAAAAAVGRITTAHIFVLDHSLSMGYRDRWERAKRAASDFMRRSGPDDRFAVLEFSDRTLARTQFTSDASDARSQLNGIELTDQSTQYGQALRAAEKFALDAGTARRVIYLISDFQQNGWTAEDQDFRFSSGIEFQYYDAGSDDFSNLAFRDVRVSDLGQSAADAIGIKATIANFGNLDRKNIRVNLAIDGRSIGERMVDIVKGGSQGVEFTLPGLTSGTHSVILDVEDSNLTRDNRFYLTIEARGKTPVLVVEGIHSGGKRSPSFFLSKALNVDALSPYKMTLASSQNPVFTGGLLIWNDAPGGSAATQRKLQDFVKAGGGLAVVVADSVHPSDFNRTFGSWLPVKVREPEVAETYSKSRPGEHYVLMTDVRMDHPIFQPFSRPNSGSFSGARFFRYAKISAMPGVEIPARFENGDPALVSIPVEKGRVLIFASSADDSANDLPLKAVYAPFWQQMLHYLENFQERRHWLDVGDAIAPKKLLMDTALRRARADADLSGSIAVLDPGRKRVAAVPGSDSIAADRAGFYEIRAMNLNATVAVNPLPRESDLTHGNAEEMTAGWVSGKPTVFAQDDRPAPEEQDRRQRIWSLLLVAAALFLISELVLSNLQLMADNRNQPVGISSGGNR